MNPVLLGVPGNIIERFWDSLVAFWTDRLVKEAPATVKILQDAEALFLGPTADLTLNPVVQDVFTAMRVAGLILLAFCTVISLAELAEASITGAGGGLVGWFKRFFVATLMTFGGLQFYGLWVRLFNALLAVFRDYLDTHWTSSGSLGDMYLQLTRQTLLGQGALAGLFVVLTLLILLALWFLIGGVRQAELILNMILAPLVWPLYLVPSVEDIPKSAFRGFLGLNAMLLIAVAMVRVAVRMAISAGEVLNIWQLVPSIAMLGMTIFLPATVRRIVGQGHTGVGALAMAVQIASGLKLLSMGVPAGGAAAAARPATSELPSAPSGPSAYPVAPVPSTNLAAAAQPTIVRMIPPTGLPSGPVSPEPMGLQEPLSPEDTILEMGEKVPGTGKFNVIRAIRRRQEGEDAYRNIKRIYPPEKEGDD